MRGIEPSGSPSGPPHAARTTQAGDDTNIAGVFGVYSAFLFLVTLTFDF